MSDLNLFQRINLIMKDVSYVKKGAVVGYGNSSYTAVQHDDVTRALNAPCVAHGVVMLAEMESCETIVDEFKDKYDKVKQRFQANVWAKVTLFNADKPDENVSVRAFAMAFDTQDKASGKAYSMAVKYCYLKAFMLESGDKEESRLDGNYEVLRKDMSEEHKKDLADAKFEMIALLKESALDSAENIEVIKKMSLDQLKTKIYEYKKNNMGVQ